MDWTGGLRTVRARGLTASILASAVLSCLLWTSIPEGDVRRFRRIEAARLLEELHQAARLHASSRGAFPPGDGNGSRGLAEVLGRDGDFANPIAPAAPWPFGIVHYRRNASGSAPPIELWVHDRAGPPIVVPRGIGTKP